MLTNVRYCTSCLMPDTRPRVHFSEEGVCNACLNAENKPTIDWEAREAFFKELLEKHRPQQGHYDCVVPWSGGKDSSTIAHKLKFQFGLNPLLVTFSPLIPNEVGEHNREEMLKLGFDHIMVRPNQKVARRLARRFFIERGNPKVAWDAGVNSPVIQVAVNYGIPLVFYAEHGETEYGGRVLNKEAQIFRDFTEVLEHQIGDDPHNWEDEEIDERDLAPYLYPDLEAIQRVGVRAAYFAYFFKWSMFRNYNYIREVMPHFKTAKGGRTCGTFTNFDSLDDKIDDLYYYMQYIKFGFGRCIRDASRLISNGHITREQGLEHVRNYDGEYPWDNHKEVLEYLDMDEKQFFETIDLHRNPEIWTKESGEWKLRFPPE